MNMQHYFDADIHTSSSDFAKYSKRLGRILVEDALTELPTQPTVVETPCGQYSGVSTPSIEANCICVVPILRAGNALLDSVLECLPGIPVGSLLLQRDETSPEKTSKHYYTKLPSNIHNKVVLLLDPMVSVYRHYSFFHDTVIHSYTHMMHTYSLNIILCLFLRRYR